MTQAGRLTGCSWSRKALASCAIKAHLAAWLAVCITMSGLGRLARNVMLATKPSSRDAFLCWLWPGAVLAVSLTSLAVPHHHQPPCESVSFFSEESESGCSKCDLIFFWIENSSMLGCPSQEYKHSKRFKTFSYFISIFSSWSETEPWRWSAVQW